MNADNNDVPDGPDELDDTALDDSALDDTALGAALGAAFEAETDDIILPPPVAAIAERAAARAKARTARRAVGSVAASVALVAGGVVGWQAMSDGDDDPDEVAIMADAGDGDLEDEVPDSEPATESAEGRGEGDSGPAPEVADVSPEDYTTGPVLEWAEIEGLGSDGGSLMSLPDGRVLARVWDGETDQVLVTADGVSWDAVPTPPGLTVGLVELGEDLWVATGFGQDDADFRDQVFVSDDEGQTWASVSLPVVEVDQALPYVRTQTFISGAAPIGDRIVVVTSSYPDLDMGRIIVDLGLAESEDQLRGWGYDSDGPLTVDVAPPGDEITELDGPGAYETFEVIPEDLGLPADFLDLINEPDGERFSIHIGDAGGLELVEERQGSPSRLVSVDGTLVLTTFAPEGTVILTSVDGQAWTETPAPDGFEVAGSLDGTLWGTSWASSFTMLRLVDGVLEDEVSFPGLTASGTSSAGPSGFAATVSVDQFVSDADAISTEPDETSDFEVGVLAAKDGIELRIEEDGSGVLIDVEADEVLRTFTQAEMDADDAPAGVIEVDDGEPEDFRLRIEDPETGEEIVTFRMEDFSGFVAPMRESGEEAFTTGTNLEGFDEVQSEPGFPDAWAPPETWVGWSADGTDWGFERIADAFGVPEGEEAWAQVAVGDGFVVAAVESFPTDGRVVEEGGGRTVRWFLATP